MESKDYKDWIRSLFDGASGTYGKYGSSYFTHFARRLVDIVDPPLGTSVLDVAMGRGAILIPAAQKIGLGGRAVGIDLSPKMVNEVENELKGLSLSHVSVREMDADSLQFNAGSFDTIFCGFSLFFMPDIKQVLSEFRRVLKEDGVVALSTWGKRDTCHSLLRDCAKTFGIDPKVTFHDFHEPSCLAELLEANGFGGVRTTSEVYDQIYPDIDSWHESLWSHGTRGILERIPKTRIEEFFSVVSEKVSPFLQNDGLHEKLQAFYTIGRTST